MSVSSTPVRSDEDIRVEIEERVLPAIDDVDTALVRVCVECGVVLVVGRVDWDSQAPIVAARLGEVDGVVEVRNRLRCTWDDVSRYPWHPHLPKWTHHRRHPKWNRR
ncbi:BON domain-containing protein [Actinokineospora auranticolor]|uniref:BON domain-containing protein n=1 Tax=Actinokineospora auranticolor TaxID=155976 RepID=A0A2S6GDF7_9PSEU|nr:BON domain-containing protein [Actinokineospora auranticolor]PPK63284.1 BON domain-containing protein [Actinokineospora auranticolor]